MARELLAEARIKDGATPNDAYAAAANVALGEITAKWNKGHGPPGEDTHVRNVHLKDDEGKLLGFRLYLVWNEPLLYGKPEVEVTEETS
jgi:hypothetical protein